MIQLAVKNMRVSVYRLMVDPEFYLYSYASTDDSSEFLIVEESQLEAAPFIDNRFERFARGQFRVPYQQLLELDRHLPKPRPQQYFIFHHAFVCSTLLARCLARSSAFFSLKEPHILRRLSDIKFHRQAPYLNAASTSRYRGADGTPSLCNGSAGEEAWSGLVTTSLRLLCKQYSHGNGVVIKASNVSNNLIPELARLSRSPMLYLHGSLQGFLISNLKKAADTREKIPGLLQRMAQYGKLSTHQPALFRAAQGDFFRQCALLWLVSNEHFLEQAEVPGRKRFRSLCAERFLAEPRSVLASVSAWFDHPANERDLDAMTAPELFGRHAKDPRLEYNEENRRAENAQVMQRFHDEIRSACRWLQPAVESLNTRQRLDALAV